MTVECQLKISRHNSQERTWGHHLQYDRFRTKLNKNWRELTGNNFTDHVTKTCSDNSRSRDLIVAVHTLVTLYNTTNTSDFTFVASNTKCMHLPLPEWSKLSNPRSLTPKETKCAIYVLGLI